jgi:hypothetical protein
MFFFKIAPPPPPPPKFGDIKNLVHFFPEKIKLVKFTFEKKTQIFCKKYDKICWKKN